MDVTAFPVPVWTHLVRQLPELSRPVTIALPCVGLDGASAALIELGYRSGRDFIPVHVYDVQDHLRQPLCRLHGEQISSGFHLGPGPGDVTEADYQSWGPVDGIISGPPCPPFSSIGRGLEDSDPRAAVFSRLSDILVDQGHKGACFFVCGDGVRHFPQEKRPGPELLGSLGAAPVSGCTNVAVHRLGSEQRGLVAPTPPSPLRCRD